MATGRGTELLHFDGRSNTRARMAGRMPQNPVGLDGVARNFRYRGHDMPAGSTEMASVVKTTGVRTIVVAVDRDEDRDAMGHWLRQAGFEVVAATDSSELLDLMSERPDVVVLDALLAGRTGFELAQR